MKLYNLFSSPLFVTNRVCESSVRDFLNNTQIRVSPSKYIDRFGSFSDNTYILNTPECSLLKEHIETLASDIMKNHMSARYSEMMMTQSWVTIKETNQWHHKHSHPNSILSGVYYYDGFEDISPIVFYNPLSPITQRLTYEVEDNGSEEKPLSWESFTYKPAVNDLIIFPSYLEHMVLQNTNENSRKSIAFNLIPKYGFGNKQGMDQIFFS